MIPLPGMFATIRSRLGVVVAVSPHDAREGGRTHLVSPAMAAAAGIAGRFVDVRELV